MQYLFFLSLPLYLVLLTGWWIAEKEMRRYRQALGFAAIIAAGPFFILLGMFFDSFDTNQCYSQAIAEAAQLQARLRPVGAASPEAAVVSSRLPLRGYETSCREVREALAREREAAE